MGYVTLDQHGLVLEVNLPAASLLGTSRAAPVGKPLARFILPEDRDVYYRQHLLLTKTGQRQRCEVRLPRAVGDPVWVWLDATVAQDEAGGAPRYRIMLTDITERKQVEETLRQSEERFRVALAAAPIVVINQDREQRYTWIGNPALGLKAEEAIGRTDAELLGDEAAAPLTAIKCRVLESGRGERQEVHVVRHGESGWFDLTVEPLRDGSSQVVGITCVAVDITQRKRTEQTLQDSERRFTTIFHTSPVAIGISRLADGKFLEINEAFVRLYGYTREEIIGHTSEELGLWHSGDRKAILRELREKQLRQVVEMQGRRKDGEVRDLQAGIELIELSGEICVLGILADLTDHKRNEEALRELSSRLLAVQDEERRRVARELHDQTAQRLVALAVELKTLETNLAAGQPQGGRVQTLRKLVDGLQEQVRQIAWDLRAGELVEGDLENALREYVEEWSARAHVPVDCECRGVGGERLPAPVEAALYRVAQEALANVEKHAKARCASVLLEREEALVRLTVEDAGCGFDVDAVQKSSEAEQRLGLLGMKERVALVGGTLLLESTPGTGTTILVRIPISREGKPR